MSVAQRRNLSFSKFGELKIANVCLAPSNWMRLSTTVDSDHTMAKVSAFSHQRRLLFGFFGFCLIATKKRNSGSKVFNGGSFSDCSVLIVLSSSCILHFTMT